MTGRRVPWVVLAAASLLAGAASALTPGHETREAGVVRCVEGLAQRRGAGEPTWVDLDVGATVFFGDSLRTQVRGQLQVRFHDRDEARNAGPSYLVLRPGTEVELTGFEVRLEDPRRSHVAVTLWKGQVRTFMKGWGRNSSFVVRAGEVACVVRGSEQLVSFGGTGTVFQTNLSGTVSSSGSRPGELPLRRGYQRWMPGPDPSTWRDVLVREARFEALNAATGCAAHPGAGF